MRAVPLLLLFAFVGVGCASRLPLPADASSTQASRASTPAPRDDAAYLERLAERLSGPDACFARCGLEVVGEGGEAAEELERHELTVFLGYTFERGEGGSTFGLDYAYKLNRRIGVGPFFDYVAGEIDAFAVGAGVWIRPFRRLEDLSFQVAPGIDIAHEKEEGEHGHEGDRSWVVAPLLRLGVTYGFDLGRGFRIAPSAFLDLIHPDKVAYVVGLTFGKEW